MINLESVQKMLNARGEFNKFDKSQNSDTGNWKHSQQNKYKTYDMI